jgi:hypothetical protein
VADTVREDRFEADWSVPILHGPSLPNETVRGQRGSRPRPELLPELIGGTGAGDTFAARTAIATALLAVADLYDHDK